MYYFVETLRSPLLSAHTPRHQNWRTQPTHASFSKLIRRSTDPSSLLIPTLIASGFGLVFSILLHDLVWAVSLTVFVLRRYLSICDTQPAPVIQNSVTRHGRIRDLTRDRSSSGDDRLCYPLAATAMACESFCMEEMDVRSRSEATASRSREAGLTMHYLGRDDINKRRRSFAVIATIFIGSWSDENHLFK